MIYGSANSKNSTIHYKRSALLEFLPIIYNHSRFSASVCNIPGHDRCMTLTFKLRLFFDLYLTPVKELPPMDEKKI